MDGEGCYKSHSERKQELRGLGEASNLSWPFRPGET